MQGAMEQSSSVGRLNCLSSSLTLLIVATHAWVSVETMMDACLVGMLVPG